MIKYRSFKRQKCAHKKLGPDGKFQKKIDEEVLSLDESLEDGNDVISVKKYKSHRRIPNDVVLEIEQLEQELVKKEKK
jgi:hypothetical protein